MKSKTLLPKVVLLMLVTAIAFFNLLSSSSVAESNHPDALPGTEIATFAGGCFWCMEPPFDKLKGVQATISGYIGGHVENPTYQQVSRDSTGHTEAVQVHYDPKLISYEQLLEVFWRNIDPFTANRQFCDGGSQYRAGIFTHGNEQLKLAQASLAQLEQNKPIDAPIVTEVTPATTFYPAEEYHQDYYIKNPFRYKYYRYGCGRDKRLAEIWNKP